MKFGDNKSSERCITVVEAGRKGGLTVLTTRGKSWFAQIGSEGQKALRAKYPNMAREWGRKGGRPRKPNLSDLREPGE
ncbi:MAG: hypothetical protein FJ006_12795 [Chloroflexi bacterium]|nr:hypothetical protein [Chloroflexota bacterium]